MSNDNIVDELVTFLFAGYDTTAIALTYDELPHSCGMKAFVIMPLPLLFWLAFIFFLLHSYTVYLLSRHPDVLRRVRAEVRWRLAAGDITQL
jgi:hypothetical protein